MALFLDRRLVLVVGFVFWLLSVAVSLWMVTLVRGVGQRLELLEGQFQVETMAHTAQMNDLEARLHQLETKPAPSPTVVVTPAPKPDNPERPIVRGRLLNRLKGRK